MTEYIKRHRTKTVITLYLGLVTVILLRNASCVVSRTPTTKNNLHYVKLQIISHFKL